MPTALRHQASQAIVLLLTSIALIGSMGVELWVDHEHCNETICAFCGGFNEEDLAAIDTDRLGPEKKWLASLDPAPALDVTRYNGESARLIRAPPFQV